MACNSMVSCLSPHIFSQLPFQDLGSEPGRHISASSMV